MIELPLVPTNTEPPLTAAEIAELSAEVRALAAERDAVILAHNYQLPEIQDVAHIVGDSLSLSKDAASVEQSVIAFCGVHFMAETASILSPEKTVLIPDLKAGCSLADSITAPQLAGWQAKHPGAITVMYVNTTAEVKALTDYCCTSGNAVSVVRHIVEEHGPGVEILFGPDMFLGSYVAKETGHPHIRVWDGECHVHAGIRPGDIDRILAEEPGAELLVHPECGCASQAMAFAGEQTHILSTEGMLDFARSSSRDRFKVATETGILHRLHKDLPGKRFEPVNQNAVCRFMKMITLEKLRDSLRDWQFEVTVDEGIAARARLAIERMVATG